MTIGRVEPLDARLGALVEEVDLRTLDDDEVEALREIIHEHEVIFLPGQHLTDEQHLAFARRLGPVAIFPMARLYGQTEPTVTTITDGPDSPPAADEWHTDVTWSREPPDYAVLRATVMPERGGDTLWASTSAAYDDLDEAARSRLDALQVVHSPESFLASARTKIPSDEFERLGIQEYFDREHPPVRHPLVRTHPITGCRSLFLGGGFMRLIDGIDSAESDELLAWLEAHIENPAFHVRWQWSVGDVAIWDERTTNHRATAEHFPAAREVRRCEVGGSVPV